MCLGELAGLEQDRLSVQHLGRRDQASIGIRSKRASSSKPSAAVSPSYPNSTLPVVLITQLVDPDVM
jgi:hypothetical protein